MSKTGLLLVIYVVTIKEQGRHLFLTHVVRIKEQDRHEWNWSFGFDPCSENKREGQT